MIFFDPQKKKNFKSFLSPETITEKYKKETKHINTCLIGIQPSWTEEVLKQRAFKSFSFLGLKLLWRKENPYFAFLSGLSMGAGGAGVHLEYLISLGIKEFIFLGFCGSLKSSLKIGSICRVDKAFCDENVSKHYGNETNLSYPGSLISQKLKGKIEAIKVSCWSTQSPFRETHHEISHYQRQGLEVCDMETSALFSIASYKGVEMASYLVVTDELFYDQWNYGFSSKKVKESYTHILESLQVDFS